MHSWTNDARTLLLLHERPFDLTTLALRNTGEEVWKVRGVNIVHSSGLAN